MSDETKIYLGIDDIEKADDIRYDETQAWGGTVRFGSLCAEDMMDFLEANEGPARKTAGIRLLVKSLVDGEGNRIGTDKHLGILKKKDSSTITRLVGCVMELNGLRTKAMVDAKNASSEASTDASPTVLH